MAEGGDSKGPAKLSKVEGLKLASDYLRGQILSDLTAPGGSISEESSTLLKFHGSYQQDDRDTRATRRGAGLEKDFQFMVRVRMPGGKCTARQYLACDSLSQSVGNRTLRITTRQEFQLYGVLKQDLKSTIRTVNEVLLSTLAACGDVERNVLSCPAPLSDGIRSELQQDCDAFTAHFAPRSSSYWEIWLDGEKVENPLLPAQGPSLVKTAGDDAVETIYGKTYMPRKFKTAFALPNDNCTDVYANDLGFLAVENQGRLVGYNVLVGGGLGTTPSATKTFPALGQPLAFIQRADLLRVGEAIIKVTRDFGDRADRKRARLKYLLYDWGMARFRAKVEEYLGNTLRAPEAFTVAQVHDHMGWHEQGDGRLWLGLPVDCGRIQDQGSMRLLSGLRSFFERFGTPARMTCQQSILLIDLNPEWKAEIESWLEKYGIATLHSISTVRRWSMACPALPTCGLAVTEAERALPNVLSRLESLLIELNLEHERFTLRMTGCPNGCARPYNADIGLVGRSAAKPGEAEIHAGTYTIFLGGSTLGHQLNILYKDYVPYASIVDELRPVLTRFREERLPGEGLGEFCRRAGVVDATAESTSST
jgi:sulfite reductase (ferredoxin)